MTPDKRTLSDVMERLLQAIRRRKGETPFTLLLGSAVGPVDQTTLESVVLAEEIDLSRQSRMSPAQRAREFRRIWAGLEADRRTSCYKKAFDAADRRAWERAYRALAMLVQGGYFAKVITTQVHSLLENKLVELQQSYDSWRTFIFELERGGALLKADLQRDGRPIKIIKIYGELYRDFAVSEDDCKTYIESVGPILKDDLKAVLAIGCTNRDAPLASFLPAESGPLYYVSRDTLPVGFSVSDQKIIDDGSADPAVFFWLLGENLRGLEQVNEVTGAPVPDDAIKEVLESPSPVLAAIQKHRKLVEPVGQLHVALVQEMEPVLLRIEYDNEQVRFGLTGEGLRYQSSRGHLLRMPLDGLRALAQQMGRDILVSSTARRGDAWRSRAKWEGRRLYQDIFGANRDLMEKLGIAQQAAGADENLWICLAGPREHLGIPYELLCDDSLPLPVRYPLYREITGINVRSPSFSEVCEEVERTKGELRVLLIASDVGGLSVDREVEEIASLLVGRKIGIKIVPEILHSDHASLAEVQARLRNCQYHIVHFAGESVHVEERPEESRLLVWSGPGRSGGIGGVTAAALSMLLRPSKTSLFFFNSCRAAADASDEKLLDGDTLGLVDSVVQAGVPAAVGYRWSVQNESARLFALAFYDALFTSRKPASAVLAARKELYASGPSDETWASAVAVVHGT